VQAGEASLDTEGDQITGCSIDIDDGLLDSSSDLTGTLTHEIGHCLGLDHAQQSENAVMSYFLKEEGNPRLRIDDKMGVSFIYPVDAAAAEEQATFGASCSLK